MVKVCALSSRWVWDRNTPLRVLATKVEESACEEYRKFRDYFKLGWEWEVVVSCEDFYSAFGTLEMLCLLWRGWKQGGWRSSEKKSYWWQNNVNIQSSLPSKGRPRSQGSRLRGRHVDRETSRAHPRPALCVLKHTRLLWQSPWQILPALPLFGRDAAAKVAGKVPGGAVTAAGKRAGLGGPDGRFCSLHGNRMRLDPAGGTLSIGLPFPRSAFLEAFFHVVLG